MGGSVAKHNNDIILLHPKKTHLGLHQIIDGERLNVPTKITDDIEHS